VVQLSVVLPCYKDAGHLQEGLRQIQVELEKARISSEIIIVNDCSPDDLDVVAKKIIQSWSGPTEFKYISLDKNLGRGGAFMAGTAVSSGEILALIDIDLEISPRYLSEGIKLISQENLDVVVGQRNFVQQSLIRKILSWGYRFLVSLILQTPWSLDTASGFKLFKRDAIKAFEKTPLNQGWFWDTEIVIRILDLKKKVGSLKCDYQRKITKSSTVRIFADPISCLYCLITFALFRR